MARPNRGKQFEEKFYTQWKKCFPNKFIYRLKDDMSGYYGSSNPCDFLCLPKDKLYMIETKTHYDNRFPWSDFSQYEDLLEYRDCENVNIGLVVWFIDFDRILYFPLDSITQMMNDGLKSINLNKIDELNRYYYIEVPSIKKRVFMESDYHCIIDREG